MDEEAKKKFKWKFYHLTVELNVIILLAAVAIIAFLISAIPFRIPLMAVAVAGTAVLAWDFNKRYARTKAWLDEQPDKREGS